MLHYPGEPVDRFLCPGERETTMLGDSPTHKEPQAHRGRHSPRHLQPRPGREKEGPSLQPWGPGERRDPPCGPGALKRGETLPAALGPWREKEGPALEPWGSRINPLHHLRRQGSLPISPGQTSALQTRNNTFLSSISWSVEMCRAGLGIWC